MSILIDITANQMIDLFGKSEWMRDFSHEANLEILAAYETYQTEMLANGHNYDDYIGWEEFFMDAGEFIEADIEQYQDEIDSYTRKIHLDNGNVLCMSYR